MSDGNQTPVEQPSPRPGETRKAPILDYEVRKVMPMSRKVLLAGTGGAAIVVSGALYLTAQSTTVVVGGSMLGPTTRWIAATQPANTTAMPGSLPAYSTNWVPTTRPVAGGAVNDASAPQPTTRPAGADAPNENAHP